MMKNTLITVLLTCMILLLWLLPLAAKDQFGTASVTRGVLTVMRNGESIAVAEGNTTTVQQLDVLVAGTDSSVSWKIDNASAMEIGDNGIVMIKPWIRAGDNGYINLVFGAVKIQSTGTDSIRTPSAAINVSETSQIEVTSTGSTLASVITGKLNINNLAGRDESLAEGRTAMVINGELIIPEPDRLAGLNLGGLSLGRPAIGSKGSESFKAEAALLGAGILSQEELQESKSTDVTIEESFDVQIDSETELKQSSIKPVSSEMVKDLKAFGDMQVIEVEPETDEFGTIQVREDTPSDVFAEFSEPKSPGQLFDLDDKTGWSRESGLIQLNVEK